MSTTEIDMTTTIFIHKSPTGFRVSRHKTAGLEKGIITLAEICGGHLGRVLTIELARNAATMNMADRIIYHDGETGTGIEGEQQIIDIMAEREGAA
jgi:hypothetical protein